MLLKIDFNKNDVVSQSDGRIVLKVRHCAEFANVCHLNTVKGETESDLYKNMGISRSSKDIHVGPKGDISF